VEWIIPLKAIHLRTLYPPAILKKKDIGSCDEQHYCHVRIGGQFLSARLSH